MKIRKSLIVIALVALSGLLLAACAPGTAAETPDAGEPAGETAVPEEPTTETPIEEMAEEPTEEAAPEEEMTAIEGDVVVDGSSTVYPITTAVAEEFQGSFSDVRVSVGLSGTGGGFAKFCIGETDIPDASRPIKDEEAALCDENGIEWTELLVALDGLTVMVNPQNDWLECLSQDQLAALFEADSSITSWSDLDPSFPDEAVLFFIPDPDSGTRDYMIEVVEGISGAEDLRQDENTTFSSDDNVLLDGIANEEYAVGFFGYAYYINNQDAVRAVAIENDAGECVLPSETTVQDGTYNPLSRPLFIYTNDESVRTKPQVAEFVRYYFAEGAEAVMGDVGYSLPPAGTYEENLAALESVLAQ